MSGYLSSFVWDHEGCAGLYWHQPTFCTDECFSPCPDPAQWVAVLSCRVCGDHNAVLCSTHARNLFDQISEWGRAFCLAGNDHDSYQDHDIYRIDRMRFSQPST